MANQSTKDIKSNHKKFQFEIKSNKRKIAAKSK